MVHKPLTVDVREIPHADHRYETVGDYFTGPDGVLHFRISIMPDWRCVRLVLIHELIEQALCQAAGVTHEQIDQFDAQFEADRLLGRHADHEEPGDDPGAPYRVQHLMATAVEKMCAAAMGVDWKAYEEAVNAL